MKLWKAALAGTVALFFAQQPAQAEMKSITIGTNPSGSAYFLIASGFAKVLQENLQIRTTAQPFAGTSVYIPSLAVGDLTVGLVSTVDSGLAYTGSGDFTQEYKGLRGLANVWSIPYAYVTRADSGIITADDFRGKRIMGVNPTSLAMTSINEAIVKSGGLKMDEVEFMTYGGLMDGFNAMLEGRVDASPVATSLPALLEAQATVDGGLRIVGNGSVGSRDFFPGEVTGLSEVMAKTRENRPYIIGDTMVVSFNAQLLTDAALAEDDAYAITKALYENWKSLQSDIGQLRSIPQDQLALASSPVPYHAGAVKFYKEVGLWTATHEANQAQF